MSTPTAKEVALAKRVNIKWRKWVRASDKLVGYYSDEDVARSVKLLNEFGAFMRDNEVHDFCDGEAFGIQNDDGTLRFRFRRTGDPVFTGFYSFEE